MNAPARPTIGVVEAPDLAHALTLLGFSVVGGGDFRASALAIRSDPNVATAPVIIFDATKPGLRAWVDRQIIGGSRVVVLRGAGTGSIPPETGVNLQLPVTVNDVLAQAGWGPSPHPLGQATVTAEGHVPDLSQYIQVAPVAEPEPEAVVEQLAPVVEQPAAPAFTQPTEHPAEPALTAPAVGLPDWMDAEFGAGLAATDTPLAPTLPEQQEFAAPTTTPAVGLPDWMESDFGSAPAATPSTEIAPGPQVVEQAQPEFTAPAAGLPDWMDSSFGTAPAEPTVTTPPATPAQVAYPSAPEVAAVPVYVAPPAAPVATEYVVQPPAEVYQQPVDEELDFDAMVAQASGASFQTFPPVAPPVQQPEFVAAPPAQPDFNGAPPAYQPPAQPQVQQPYDPFAQQPPQAPAQAPYNPFPTQPAQPQQAPQQQQPTSKYVDPAAQGPATFGTEQFNADFSAPAFATAAAPGPTFGGHTGGKVIVSFAGKGGVGKTSCALAMAQRASEAGLRVAVVDMNRGQGDVRTFLRLANPNLPSIYNSSISGLMEDAVLSPQQINDSRHPNLPKLGFALVLAPPPELADPRIVTAEVYRKIIEFLKSKVDLVIVDTQIAEAHDTTGLIENLVIPSLIDGAWGLGVTDMSSAGLNNLLGRVKKFATHGVDRKHMLLAVNKAASFDTKDQASVQELFGAYATFAGAAGADLDFANQLNVGIVDVEATALRPLIDHVLLTVTGNEAFTPQPQRRRGLFGRRK